MLKLNYHDFDPYYTHHAISISRAIDFGDLAANHCYLLDIRTLFVQLIDHFSKRCLIILTQPLLYIMVQQYLWEVGMSLWKRKWLQLITFHPSVLTDLYHVYIWKVLDQIKKQKQNKQTNKQTNKQNKNKTKNKQTKIIPLNPIKIKIWVSEEISY